MGRTNTWLCQTRSRESSSRLSSQIVTILSPWRRGSRIRARKIDAVLLVLFRQTGQLGGSGPIVYIGTREGEYVLLGYNVLFELRVLGRYEIEAAARSVCICTYTHLAVLVRYAKITGQSNSIELLHDIFKAVEAMNPSKDAGAYWHAVNRVFLDADRRIADIWREEKIASLESIAIAREEALSYFAKERERIMKLSRKEAIREVLQWRKLGSRVQAVKSVKYNGLLEVG